MTERVDFYVLKSTSPNPRWQFACRLAEKAYLRDLRVVMWSETAADARLLDDLLWTFSERSFVPHALLGESGDDPDTPVRLASSLDGAAPADLLINLSARLPSDLERFKRVAEVLDANEELRRLGRERFKAYRDLKLAIDTHQLDDTATP